MASWKHAFKLSKTELRQATPPGTIQIVEHVPVGDSSGTDKLLLQPPPTNRPEDPLNWPLWRKLAILCVVCLYACVADFVSAVPASAIPTIAYASYPPRPFSEVTHLISYNVLCIGLSNLLWIPIANTFGRRIVLILGTLLMTLTSMWCALATSFPSLLAARAMQGLAEGPSFTIPAAVIGEVFFVHQVGKAMTLYTGMLGIGPFIGGITGGYIATRLGVPAIFWISMGCSGLVLVLVVLLVPETLFDRQKHLAEMRQTTLSSSESSHEKISTVHQEAIRAVEPLKLAQALKAGTYRPGFLGELSRPWLTLRLPAVWVAMLQIGGLVGGIVTISTVGPTMLTFPPYNWGDNNGLFNIGGLVANFLAIGTTALVVDRLIRRQARRQADGIYEAEVRLPLALPGLFLATTGLWVFGFCAAHPGGSMWGGLVVGYGMVTFGLVQSPSIGFTYIVDSYRHASADCFVMIGLARSIISFAWTFFVSEWISEAGPALPFGIFGMLMGLFGLLTIPQYFYGKRLRVATASYIK